MNLSHVAHPHLTVFPSGINYKHVICWTRIQWYQTKSLAKVKQSVVIFTSNVR